MRDIVNINNSEIENEQILQRQELGLNLIEITDDLLLDARNTFLEKDTISMPIAQMATLGVGIAAIVPSLRTITQTTTVDTTGLYRVVNMGAGDVLKMAKDGNFWGALKNVSGKSTMAKFQAVAPIASKSSTVIPVDPATLLIAVALFAIDQKLKPIAETGKQIISFLETEKESEIEADIETLLNIIMKYKFNWDNEQYIYGNHKMVLDIQRTARKNMTAYQKKVVELLNSKHLIVAQSKVNTTLKNLLKKFKYYRLSLYIFSMSSFLEIMLSGNFKEEYITSIKTEIENMSMTYRDVYSDCSIYLEKLSSSSLEINAMKGVGIASKAVGKLIGNIPVIKDGSADELLQDSGDKLKKYATESEKNTIGSFAEISNPETFVFIEKMKDMIQIYNHTQEIYFDKNNIYLVAK